MATLGKMAKLAGRCLLVAAKVVIAVVYGCLMLGVVALPVIAVPLIAVGLLSPVGFVAFLALVVLVGWIVGLCYLCRRPDRLAV